MKGKENHFRQRFTTQFPYLKEDDISAFFSICEYRAFKNKETIFHAGSTARKAIFVLSGVVRGYILDKKGVEKNMILRMDGTAASTPEWLFGNMPTQYTFEAILACELLIFNIVDFEELAKKNEGIFELFSWMMKENLNVLRYRVDSMVNMTPEERYSDLLSKYPILFQTALNKHIANFLGITPVSLSRITKRLKEN